MKTRFERRHPGKGGLLGGALSLLAGREELVAVRTGPELVHPEWRGRGVGHALLLVTLEAMRAQGYAYAIIGWASSVDFYRKAVGATVIDGSRQGIYPPPLKG